MKRWKRNRRSSWLKRNYGFETIPENISARKLYGIFTKAVKKGRKEVISLVAKEHKRCHDYDGDYGDFVSTVEYLKPDLLEYSLKCGLDIDGASECGSGCCYGSTLLQMFSSWGEAEKVKLAIKYGADLEKKNSEGETALGFACAWGHLEVVKVLVEAGADVNNVEYIPGENIGFSPCAPG